MIGIKKAVEKIEKAKDIAIAGHINPDGDSIGSILSLGLGLARLGKNVSMISEEGVPKRYRNLPGADLILKSIKKTPELAISVDCGDRKLLGKTFKVFKKAKDILEIDHHEFRKPYGNVMLVDEKAAAVGELVYLLLKDLNIEITTGIAQNILTSIIVETNSFRLPNIRPLTFKICAELISRGVDFYNLVDAIYWAKSREAAILLGLSLSRCKFTKEGKLVWSAVCKKDFDRAGGKDEDVDPVVDEMRSIKNVEVAVFFREKKRNVLRVSMRSKGKINIAAIAEKYDGGGHYDSAGCCIPNNADSVKALLRSAEGLLV